MAISRIIIFSTKKKKSMFSVITTNYLHFSKKTSHLLMKSSIAPNDVFPVLGKQHPLSQLIWIKNQSYFKIFIHRENIIHVILHDNPNFQLCRLDSLY